MLTTGILLGAWTLAALAEAPKSLLPVFGTAGREIQPKAMQGYDIRGWLPKDWVDNSSWAPVSAVYSQLNDPPEAGVGAVRIEVTKRHAYHLQMTTKEGAREYKQGTTYVVTGWVRSPQLTGVFAGFRQDEDPKNFYAGQDLYVGADWKKFSVEWTPEKDSLAWLMFTVHEVGIVDLAGIAMLVKE
jgi:hypothetical protein